MTDATNIRALTAADAEKLSACFRRCYGDSYATAFFYDPAEIRRRIAAGRLESVVATTPDGEIVGHMALTRSHGNALTVELGSAIVDPQYRGQGLLGRIGIALVALARSVGACGYHHYQTTAHPIIQKAAGEAGSVETGVMLGYIPSGIEYRDLVASSPKGRLAAVTVFQTLRPLPPREVFVPRRYAAVLRTIYSRAMLQRREVAPDEQHVPSSARLVVECDPKRAVRHIDVEQIGADLPARVDEIERARPGEITHVDLPLSDPAVERMVDALRVQGFFFCALLPEYAVSDVLRLQKLQAGSWVRPELVNAQAREILGVVLADRQSVSGASGGAKSVM